MNLFLAQATPPETSFWSLAPGTGMMYAAIAGGFLFGMLILFALLQTPPQLRRTVVSAVVFVSGLFYVLYFLWPKPIDLQSEEAPQGAVETVGRALQDGFSVVVPFTNIIAGFLVGLGIYSLLRIHGGRIMKQSRDWGYSVVLFVSMIAIFIIGIQDWRMRQSSPAPELLDVYANQTFVNHARDLLFDGLLQQMDAAMFSLIAFYILSAAYRAFRIRSIEATILLATALLVVVSLMGFVQNGIDARIGDLANPDAFRNNFTLLSIKNFVQNTFQTPAIRGIGFGVGIGALAMGVRIWLSLEKAGQA